MDYPTLCTRTEAPITQGTRSRFDSGCKRSLLALLNRAEHIGEELDTLKRWIFYSKKDSYNAKPSNLSEEGFRTLHVMLGKLTEAIEFANEAKKVLENRPLDLTNLLEEIGDGWWYDGIFLHMMGVSVEQIQSANIEKLRKRFPDKFTSEDALNRDLEKERDSLDSNLKK